MKNENGISVTWLMLTISVYVACPLWVGLATNSIKWGVAAFIVISMWLADVLYFPRKKKADKNHE